MFAAMNGRTSGRSRWMARVAGCGALFLAAAAAMAQDADQIVRPPAADDPGTPPVLLYYLVGVVLAGLCVGLALLPGRRSFED